MSSTSPRAGAPRLTLKGERTRERIISSAADLMFTHGVSATTIDDVRAAAGVSASQLYHYFSDKTALVHAVIQYQADRVVGSQEPSLAHLDSIQGLRAWRDSVVEMQRQTQCRGGCPIGSLVSELADQDEQARSDIAAGFERWHAGIRSGLRAMRDRGHLASDADPDNLALATLAAIQGGLLLGQVQRTTQLKSGRSRFDPAPDRPSNAIDFLPLTSMDSGNERVFVHYKRMQNLPKKVWVQLF